MNREHTHGHQQTASYRPWWVTIQHSCSSVRRVSRWRAGSQRDSAESIIYIVALVPETIQLRGSVFPLANLKQNKSIAFSLYWTGQKIVIIIIKREYPILATVESRWGGIYDQAQHVSLVILSSICAPLLAAGVVVPVVSVSSHFL